jgi:hypothetical protein
MVRRKVKQGMIAMRMGTVKKTFRLLVGHVGPEMNKCHATELI